MHTKLKITLLVFLSLILLSGCAHQFHYKDDLFEYQPAVIPASQRIDKVAGLNILSDQRPQNEKAHLPPEERLYHNFTQKVTNLLLEDFQKSQVFKEIHSPAQTTDDLIISGSINRFFFEGWEKTWLGRSYEQWWSFFFPPISLALLFGAPYANEYCIMDISLEVRDNKTNTVLVSFNESARATQGIRMSTSKLGQDVTEAFAQITRKLKANLLKLEF